MIAELSIAELAMWISACAAAIFVSGFYSGSETGVYCVSVLRLHLAAHRGDGAASTLLRLMRDQSALLFATLVGTNAGNYLAPVCATTAFIRSGMPADSAELYTTLVLTPVVFIAGEVVPKNLFQRRADRLMPLCARWLSMTRTLCRITGLLEIQRLITAVTLNRFSPGQGPTDAFRPRQTMYEMLREGAADGALTATQTSMIERIATLRSVRVGAVMTSRSKTVMLPEDATAKDVEQLVRSQKHSRVPVFRKTRRAVVGLVCVLDVLLDGEDARVADHMQPTIQVPAAMPVHSALGLLQRERRRMAIVVSGRGACLGIVTVKDLVEEIVGEIEVW